jgi:hypothetical protein
MERLFVHSTTMEETGALSQPLLLSVLALEKKLSAKLLERDLPCLKNLDGDCLTLSPWAFWAYNEGLLATDTGFKRLLTPARNVSVARIPITPRMVLAGRDEDGAESPIKFASFLALTYFFEESSCSDNAGYAAWERVLLEVATSDVDFVTEKQEPLLMALQVCLTIF